MDDASEKHVQDHEGTQSSETQQPTQKNPHTIAGVEAPGDPVPVDATPKPYTVNARGEVVPGVDIEAALKAKDLEADSGGSRS